MAAVSLTVSTVKPLGDRIFIKVSESEEKTAGGILLPDSAKEKPQVGEVAQVGPGKLNDDGSRQTPEVSIGDKVLYSKYAGTDIKLGGDGMGGIAASGSSMFTSASSAEASLNKITWTILIIFLSLAIILSAGWI